jgi:hypothetical protein
MAGERSCRSDPVLPLATLGEKEIQTIELSMWRLHRLTTPLLNLSELQMILYLLTIATHIRSSVAKNSVQQLILSSGTRK